MLRRDLRKHLRKLKLILSLGRLFDGLTTLHVKKICTTTLTVAQPYLIFVWRNASPPLPLEVGPYNPAMGLCCSPVLCDPIWQVTLHSSEMGWQVKK